MNFGEIAALTLDASTGLVASGAGTELNLQKYFINPGKRPMSALVVAMWSGSDSGTATFDYKLQESTTTVDSDFTDISGASITQVASDAAANAVQRILFMTNKQYVRGYHTTTAGVWSLAAILEAVKRDA